MQQTFSFLKPNPSFLTKKNESIDSITMEPETCSLCDLPLTDVNVATLECKDKFHFLCAFDYMKCSSKCPKCNTVIIQDDSNYRDKLHEYMNDGNLDKVIEITEIWEPDNDDGQEDDALVESIAKGHIEIVKYLIDNFQQVFISEGIYFSSAASSGSLKLVIYLLDKYDGKDYYPDIVDCAAQKNYPHIIQYLLDQDLISVRDLIKPFIRVRAEDDEDPDTYMTNFLVKQKCANVEIYNQQKTDCGLLDIIWICIRKECNDSKEDPKPMHLKVLAMKKLLENNGYPMIIGIISDLIANDKLFELKQWITCYPHILEYGKVAANLAVDHNNIPIIKYLISVGLNATEYFDQGLLRYAAIVRKDKNYGDEMVNFLVENNAYLYNSIGYVEYEKRKELTRQNLKNPNYLAKLEQEPEAKSDHDSESD